MNQQTTLLLSTAYCPPIEYFVYLWQYKRATIDLNETYPKQTWRNRCALAGGNGALVLSVPVEKPMGNRTPSSEILLSHHACWAPNHLKSFEAAYQNAPFYMFYKHILEECLLMPLPEKLSTLNHKILQYLLEELCMKVKICFAKEFVCNTKSGFLDARFDISPKTKDRKALPQLLYPKYYQVFDDKHDFMPNLSIFDLVFNLGPDTKAYLEECAQLNDLLS